MKEFDVEKRLNAVWCVDSETGDRVLLCRDTSKELMRYPCKVDVVKFVGDILFKALVMTIIVVVCYGVFIRYAY